MDIKKPFLKWLGGKTQLIKDIIKYIPKEMNSYHEIFLGGGSVLLALCCLQKLGHVKINEKIHACDLNRYLINTYKVIQDNPIELYDAIMILLDTYKNIEYKSINRNPSNIEEALTSKESYYYWIRKDFNTKIKNKEESIDTAALFIFINKICFRGMYREGPNGYNVPYGHYKTVPKVINKDDLTNISELIKDVEFKVCDFNDSMKLIKKGDFVYLDPPYVKENKFSFTSYTSDGFNDDKHNKLFDEIKKLHEKGVKFLLSNSHTTLVLNCFSDFRCDVIESRRAINSKNPESKTNEVLITNINY